MCDFIELGQLRDRISQRLRARPQDAKMEQRLLARLGSRPAVERLVTERVCYLAAVLAMDGVPEMLLDADPRAWERIESTLEAVARVFADEIVCLRQLIFQACCQEQREADGRALTAWLLDTFIVGEVGW